MLIVLDFVGVKLRYARYYRIIAEMGDYYIIIQILLGFFKNSMTYLLEKYNIYLAKGNVNFVFRE